MKEEDKESVIDDSCEFPLGTDGPKKRKVSRRETELNKIARVKNHSTGDPCQCKKECFELLNDQEKEDLINNFCDHYETKDEQDAYLASCVTVLPISRRYGSNSNYQNTASYNYHVKVVRDNVCEEVKVCFKAFLSLFDITNRRAITIKQALAQTGRPPTDGRGKTPNPRALSEAVKNAIRKHIESFPDIKSHYSLHKTTKVYLHEDLNIRKMFSMFKETNPEIILSEVSYRRIFESEYNVSFFKSKKRKNKV